MTTSKRVQCHPERSEAKSKDLFISICAGRRTGMWIDMKAGDSLPVILKAGTALKITDGSCTITALQ